MKLQPTHSIKRIFVLPPVLLLGLFLVFFFNVNSHWVVVHLPAFPWQSSAIGYSYEVSFAFLLIFPFVLGIGVSALWNRLVLSDRQKSLRDAQQTIVYLKGELTKQKKLYDAQKNG